MLLVADDSCDMRVLVRALLGEPAPFELVEAVSGEEALALASARRIDVALLDLDMPGMGGDATVAALRALPGYASIPIYAFTGTEDERVLARSRAAGFDDVLIKPPSRGELLARLRGTGGPGPRSTTPPAPAPALVHVDPGIADLVPRFLENRRRDVETLRAALAADELERVRAIAHVIKGSAGGYGFFAMTALGEELEHACESGDRRATAAVLERLAAHVEDVRYVVD